eukprot:CAMPEP_0119098044 /NCGR_PEP_ID=MMETSP1178-20130426/184327_1 /TAXON_ID=33656 /ORGANISM="unid sp, Strain CCMP2000" /LENGTH=53 /DNA_ID=CAMNT_0007082013 /DNA_START=9 /DNA_END=167 /DNA_ORIENTATION=+
MAVMSSRYEPSFWRHRAHASVTRFSTASEADSHFETISHASCDEMNSHTPSEA